jgi:hypothetical protein
MPRIVPFVATLPVHPREEKAPDLRKHKQKRPTGAGRF